MLYAYRTRTPRIVPLPRVPLQMWREHDASRRYYEHRPGPQGGWMWDKSLQFDGATVGEARMEVTLPGELPNGGFPGLHLLSGAHYSAEVLVGVADDAAPDDAADAATAAKKSFWLLLSLGLAATGVGVWAASTQRYKLATGAGVVGIAAGLWAGVKRSHMTAAQQAPSATSPGAAQDQADVASAAADTAADTAADSAQVAAQVQRQADAEAAQAKEAARVATLIAQQADATARANAVRAALQAQRDADAAALVATRAKAEADRQAAADARAAKKAAYDAQHAQSAADAAAAKAFQEAQAEAARSAPPPTRLVVRR